MRCPRSRDISSQICSKIARSRLPRPCLSAYISGTRARIGQRFSPLDRAGSEVSKNVVKKISRPNPPAETLGSLKACISGSRAQRGQRSTKKKAPDLSYLMVQSADHEVPAFARYKQSNLLKNRSFQAPTAMFERLYLRNAGSYRAAVFTVG